MSGPGARVVLRFVDIRVLALLALVVLAVPARAQNPCRVQLFVRGAERPDAETLADELRIYTRDLGAEVTISPWPESAGDTPLRGPAGADALVVWLTPGTVEVQRGADGEHRTLALGADRDASLSAAAVRIRALVASWPAPKSPEKRPDPPPPAAPVETVKMAAPPPAPRRWSGDVALTGGLVGTLAPASGAIAATLRATLWRDRFGLALEGSLRTDADPAGAGVEVEELPVGASLLRRTSWGPLELAAGPRLRAHRFLATPRGYDVHAPSRAFVSAGLGALGLARWPVTEHLDVVGAVALEAVFPRWSFTVGEEAGPTTAAAEVSGELGLGWRFP